MIFVSFVFAFAVFMIVGAAAEGISAVVGMVTRVAAMYNMCKSIMNALGDSRHGFGSKN